MINCQGCEFLRHEPPVEGGVPGQRHFFRCMNPANGLFYGRTIETVKPKYYYDGIPIRPLLRCTLEKETSA